MHNNEILNLFRRIFSALLGFLPLIFWILLIFSLESASVAVLTLACALIHETGHEIFILMKTGQINIPSGRVNGFVIRERSARMMSYGDEAMLYLSGPLANIAAAVASLLLRALIGDYAELIVAMNIATALSSLIPVEGYDGYGALKCIMHEHLSDNTATRALSIISFTLTAALSTVALYIMDRLGEGYWIFAIFTASLIGAISKALKIQKTEKNEN